MLNILLPPLVKFSSPEVSPKTSEALATLRGSDIHLSGLSPLVKLFSEVELAYVHPLDILLGQEGGDLGVSLSLRGRQSGAKPSSLGLLR